MEAAAVAERIETVSFALATSQRAGGNGIIGRTVASRGAAAARPKPTGPTVEPASPHVRH